ncbi:hypothetical protein SAMN05428988_3146 [Chitinophaga sp. YR573]|nr:hypothetical protein SAMN05428988_3146 [Chitinophaga sp. YR573]
MIENEKQYRITQRWLHNFQKSLKTQELVTSDNPLLQQIYINSLKSIISELSDEIKQYEALQNQH